MIEKIDEDNYIKEDKEFNINYYLSILDSLYFEWKKNPKLFMDKGKKRYEETYLLVEKLKDYTETKKNKINKLITLLYQNGVLRICYKTHIIKISLAALQKNASSEEKKFFWSRMKEDYIFFYHVLFYNLVLLSR